MGLHGSSQFVRDYNRNLRKFIVDLYMETSNEKQQKKKPIDVDVSHRIGVL